MKPQPKRIVVEKLQNRVLEVTYLSQEDREWVVAHCDEFCMDGTAHYEKGISRLVISKLYDIDEVAEYIKSMGQND